MWNLSQIFIGSGISGFSRIWSVCRSGRCKNAKFEQNFHRECIFLILPNFGLKMWNLSQIFIGCGISGFSRISSVCRSGRSKNAKFEKNFHRECISGFCPILGAKMWNLSQIFIARLISGFCRISSVCRSVRCKNAKFEPNFHRECIFWILPNFGGKNVKFVPNFHRQWNFWIFPDFKCLPVRKVQECVIRAEFSSRVHFLDFRGKNVKFEPNFHRQWNFWILPDFKCLQLREVQEYEIRAKFSSRVHFFDFAEFWGQTCEIWAKFSSAVEFLDFAGFQVFACPEGARMRNFSRIFIARAFFWILPEFGGKDMKFEGNFHRQWNFWILPDFKN